MLAFRLQHPTTTAGQTARGDGPFAVRDLDVASPRRVFFYQPDRDLAAFVDLAGNEPANVTARLSPCGSIQGILERELVRQALLIAARDELNLPTRDHLVEESSPGEANDNAGALPVEIAILFRRAECHALVHRGEGEKGTILQKHDLGTNPDAGNFTIKLTSTAEMLSRTEFPALLKQLGATGMANRVRDQAPLPPDVEHRLESLSMVDAFAAVPELHDAIRADGDSPERLSALARGYAQLGMLSEFLWTPAHRIFKARALLYAERLKQRANGSGLAPALYTRAFVWGLVGRHDVALRSLDEAARLVQEVKGVEPKLSPAPSWLPVGRVLLYISPYSSHAMATVIESDWDRVKGDVPAWREKVGDAPGLLGALGKKYAEFKQYDEAEKCLKRYVKLSGDEWAYQELAACREARGDHDGAKAAIDGYLTKTEPAGLEHAQVQVQIANKLGHHLQADPRLACRRWQPAARPRGRR